MRAIGPLVFIAAPSLVLPACGGTYPDVDDTDGAVVTQRAAVVLAHPHDEHEFGELPPGLAPVPSATAELERHPRRLRATLDTRIEPGRVGKLLGVVINNPEACTVPTPMSACGPHEEEFNREADGGFYLGSGAVAGTDGRISLTLTAEIGDTSNVLCGGAANPDFDGCALGFALRDPLSAEVTLVVLDNGPAAEDPELLARQLAAPSPCPDCAPFTAQIATGFGRGVDETGSR